MGVNNKLNVGTKVRLQLFEVPYGFKPKPNQTEVGTECFLLFVQGSP